MHHVTCIETNGRGVYEMNVSSNPMAGELFSTEDSAGIGGANVLDRVLLLTQRLFPGPVAIESDCDPEDSESTWWNFCVESTLDHAALRDLRAQWHDSVYQIGVSDPTQFSLLIRRP